MKRIVICVMLALALQGCGTKQTAQTITVAMGGSASTQKAYDAAINRFKAKHPDVRVQEIMVSGGSYYQKILTMFAGNSQPDVIWLGKGFGAFVSKDLLCDLTPYVNKEGKGFLKSFYQPALNSYMYKDKLYGLPNGIDFQLLYYNKDMFDRAKLKYPDSSWKEADLLQAAKRLTFVNNGRIDIYGVTGVVSKTSYGSQYLSDDGKILIDSPETAAYLRFNYDLRNKYKVTPMESPEREVGLNQEMMFTMSKSAMAMLDDYNLPSIIQCSNRIKWGVAVMPNMNAGRRRVWASTSGFSITKECRNKALAWDLVKIFASPEFMKDYYPNSLPANMDCLKQVIGDDKKLPDSAKSSIIESMQYLCIDPRHPSVFEMESIFGDMEEAVYIGSTGIDAGMKKADQQMRRLLK